jgi:hypothetical protein
MAANFRRSSSVHPIPVHSGTCTQGVTLSPLGFQIISSIGKIFTPPFILIILLAYSKSFVKMGTVIFVAAAWVYSLDRKVVLASDSG